MWSATLFTSQLSPWCHVVDTYLRFEGAQPQSPVQSSASHVWVLRGVGMNGVVRRVEVEPQGKAQLFVLGAHEGKRHLPAIRLAWDGDEGKEGETVEKAQEVVCRFQELLGTHSRLPAFSVEQKNTCMKINQEVLPVVALNRHLTLSASRETVRYMANYKEEWGWWRTWTSQLLVPIFYWRIWRKMGNAVLKDAGYATPEGALIGVLERWQRSRGDEPFFGGQQPNMVDVWMFGHVAVCRDETVFKQLIEKQCPRTIAWFSTMSARVDDGGGEGRKLGRLN